jgi:hypothetical protein
MIRTEMRAPNGEMKPLTVHDLAYWDGPYRYEPFPKVLFRCFGPQQQDIEERLCKTAFEAERLDASWKETPDEARAHERKLQDEIAAADAYAAAEAARMSATAQAEKLAYDRAHFDHTPDMPAPTKRPGRPKKTAADPVSA